MNERVREILSWYGSDCPGTLTNLVRLLNSGRLAGTGRLVILPVDQGFEHGPARSFAMNPPAYDPRYHFQLAIEAGCNAYAAPLGFLEAGVRDFAGQIPLILKANNHDALLDEKDPHQALTAIVVWSYPRGSGLTKEGETAIDVTAYAAQIAAQLGAHIIKVKLPSPHIAQDAARKVYEKEGVPTSTLTDRVRHVMQSAFSGRRIVIFSGGPAVSDEQILAEVRAIRDGGGFGSIIGRNTFQRKRADALRLLDQVMTIYAEQEA